jgi:hypothetical protein
MQKTKIKEQMFRKGVDKALLCGKIYNKHIEKSD